MTAMDAQQAPEGSAETSAEAPAAAPSARVLAPSELDIRAGESIAAGNTQALKSLIDRGLDPNALISSKNGPVGLLYACVSAQQPECLDLLLKSGARFEETGRKTESATLLEIAVLRRSHAIAGVLLEHITDVNAVVLPGWANLAHLAARRGSVPTLDVLHVHGIDLRMVNDDGDTPLHLADSPEAAHWLASREPTSIAVRNKKGRTPLMQVLHKGDEACAMAMLDYDQTLENRYQHHLEALELAYFSGAMSAASRIKALLSAKRANEAMAAIAGMAKKQSPAP